MNGRMNRVGALSICAGGFVLFAGGQVDGTASDAATTPFPGFLEYPASADADPSVRHGVEIPMPTRLSAQRTQKGLVVSYELASAKKVKITVGKSMSIGVKDELRVYAKGDPRPPRPNRIGYKGIRESSIPLLSDDFLSGATFFNSVPDGLPTPGKQYVIERDVTLFETDILPQHLWAPESGKYRVLWKKRLKTIR